MSEQPTYNNDVAGFMRVHISNRRADAACLLYTREALRNHAMAHGVVTAFHLRYKRNLAWAMAQHGLIDADGTLRDGFPEEQS